MVKIPATDGKTYSVPSWSTFQSWVKRGWIAYGILAVAMILGIYFYSQNAQRDLVDRINSYAVQSCLASIDSGSTINKYNNLVHAIVDIREQSYLKDITIGDMKQAQIDRRAIATYSKDFITVPTKKQCRHPIIKR